MKSLLTVGMVAVILMTISGCGMNSAQLGERVRKEMQAELVKNDMFKDLKMKEVRLVKGEGIEYSGVGKGDIDGYPVKFDVTCKYDGDTVIWDASLVDDNMLTLAGVAAGKAVREKAKAAYDRMKAAWPDVKKSIGAKYAAASRKAGECYESAAKKAAEYMDSEKGRQEGREE